MKGKITLIGLLISAWLHAQGSQEAYGLQECLRYALDNAINAKNAQLDIEIAKAQVKETVGIGLPQVTGSATLQYSPTQQRFFSQYVQSDDDEFSFIDAEQAQQLGLQSGEVYAAQNFFALKGSGDASVNINQMIFNGSYIVGLQASKTYKELSVKNANMTNEEIVMNVSKAYYQVLIVTEQLELVKSNIARIDTMYKNTYTMYTNGFAEKLDADRLKVNLNNLKVNQTSMENQLELAMRLLKFQMNYPLDGELQISGSLEDEALQEALMLSADSWDYERRPDYQALQVNYELQKLTIKNKYAEAVPVISAFANLGMMTQSPGFGGLFVTNTKMVDNSQVGPDKWYGYSTVGFKMSWSLFTGLQRNFQIQQEKLNLKKIENQVASLKMTIEMDVKRADDNLRTALDQLDVQHENKDLAHQIYETTRTKYEQGVGSNIEVIEADNSLKEAQTNYYSALYDAILAQLELKKALGTLYTPQ